MFVIMASSGEYSDRSVWIKGYTFNEDRAKQIVLELVSADQLDHSIKNAKSKLNLEGLRLWDIDHPYPEKDISKPAFDQSQHKNKQYVAEHIERKRLWEAEISKFYKEILGPWMLARNEFANAYVEANFTMDLCQPPEWTDRQYWYEEVEELI